jgi:16S rRNA (uracil1498-N3)-methyltransferase
MTNRFFVDRSISRWDANEALLSGDEAYHFCKVMRGKVGDSLILFDGTGPYAHGIVESIQKEGVRIRITETFADEMESPLRLTIAAALPKGDRQRFLIEKLAELGVARFLPVQMERSVARANDAVIQRLRRYVVEAAKQCGRNLLMEITNEVPMSKLNNFLATASTTASTTETTTAKFLLHPVALGHIGQTTAQQVLTNELPEKIVILAGPEGSFTDQEVDLALRDGFVPLDLGKRILRTETACIAAAAVFLIGNDF